MKYSRDSEARLYCLPAIVSDASFDNPMLFTDFHVLPVVHADAIASFVWGFSHVHSFNGRLPPTLILSCPIK